MNTQVQPKVSNAVVGAWVFVASEILFFAGLINSYLNLRSGDMLWPPTDQPRLPVEATAFNTLFLLASGVFLFWAGRLFKDPFQKQKMQRLFGIAIALGAAFLIIQGFEWVRLVSYGMTISSSLYGGLFYLIVGTHAIHAFSALIFLGYAFNKVKNAKKYKDHQGLFSVALVFWLFVVAIWPGLYYLVYIV